MAVTYYTPVITALHEAGFEVLRHGKGSHIIFQNKDGKEITVTRNLKDRHLANKMLKTAGIKEFKL